jgi:hypothetical protein
MTHRARGRAARLAGLLAGLALAACGGGIATVQRHHGREFRCDPRYVRAERLEGDRWVSRGCGFEADWRCRAGACELLDLRSHGMAGP